MAEDEDLTLLEPQTQIENLTHCLERILMTTQSAWKVIKFDEDNWYSKLEEHKQEFNSIVIDERVLTDDKNDIKYTWKQTDDYIQISLPNVDESAVQFEKERNFISVYGTDPQYQFPVLAGVFYGKVESLQTTSLGGITQIELQLESSEHWPLLIKGGQPDGLSAFYIASLASTIQYFDAVLFYLQKGAIYMNHSATLTYALTLLEGGQKEAAAHFFARGALHFGDHTCGFMLSCLLIDGDAIEPNPPVAEYILCRLCKEGFNDAYMRLGNLYLKGNLGVKKMPKRAKKLLEIAAYGFNDADALEEYQSIDWDSIIKESEEKDKAEKEQQIEFEKHKDEPIGADFLVAAGVIAGVAALGFTIYKKFFKR